ncbi:MAG: hypothetical protein VKJ04_05950 [Vampirovibrionales bacterium]|nr:hypothetical protein [Vampirovibrionales bacterium]
MSIPPVKFSSHYILDQPLNKAVFSNYAQLHLTYETDSERKYRPTQWFATRSDNPGYLATLTVADRFNRALEVFLERIGASVADEKSTAYGMWDKFKTNRIYPSDEKKVKAFVAYMKKLEPDWQPTVDELLEVFVKDIPFAERIQPSNVEHVVTLLSHTGISEDDIKRNDIFRLLQRMR